MKRINKIVIWVLVIIFAVFISCSIAIALYGKKIAVNLIEQNLKMKTSLGNISLGLPFTINLTNLEIGDLFKSDRISVNPSILGFLAGKIVLNRLSLINPVINLEQGPDGSFNLPKLKQKGKQPPVFLTGLVIKNGELIFTDKKLSPEGYRIIVGNIDARISKVMLPPASLNARFKFYASIMDPNARILGGIDSLGWIDFGPKDMDAALHIKDLDVTYFAPYYGDFISNKKLLSAKLNLTSLLKAKNNDLTVVSSFKLSDLVYAKEEVPKEGELPKLDLVKSTLDLFTDRQGNLSLDFTINTKLDNPGVNISELKRVILNAAVKNLSNQPPEALIEKVTNTLEQFKDFGKELKNIFKKKE